MKKTFFVLAFAFIAFAAVEAESEIQFPVQELGGCASEEACKSYCDDLANIESCLVFAEKNNIMSPEEIAEARKFAAIGAGPGGCTSEDSCESYCDNANNIRECISFAEKNGLMSGEELKEAKQILRALDSGVSLPGGCTNEEACDAYCADEANILECVIFAEAAGFISADEAAMVKKTGGKGPGGCRGDECETFCQNPENGEICYNFAKEYGLMDEEMERGSQDFIDSLKNAPSEVKECMESAFGDVNKIFPGPSTGAKLRECYEAYSRANPGKAFWPAEEGRGDEPERVGPGGCRNREECDAYCRANPDSCRPEGDDIRPREGEEMERREEGRMPPPPENMMPPPETAPSPEPAPEPVSRVNLFMANVLTSFASLLE